MADHERTRPNGSAAAAGNDSPGAPQSPAAALVAEGNALGKHGRLAEAMDRYKAAIQQDPQYADAHFNLGNLSYRVGDFAAALRSYQTAVSIRPQFADGHLGQANALVALGRTDDAVESYRRALAIAPNHPGAHLNLGVLAMSQGRPQEAAASLRRASALRPDNAAAHRLLGAVLSSLGELDAAETSLRRAHVLEPGSPEILYDLAMLLQYRGRYAESVLLLSRALERAPDWPTKVAFASCAARTRFSADDPRIRAALTTAISEAWAQPQDLCQSALSLILLDDRIAGCVRRANDAWPVRLPRSRLFDAGALAALSADALLQALLDAAPVTSIPLERFLTGARHALLELASSEQLADPADVAALSFYAALTRQCFINEFVFDCTESERLTVELCRTRLLALLEANATVPPLLLLAVAAYCPLQLLPGAERLLAIDQPDGVDEVVRQQIREPLQEQALHQRVKRLTPITDPTSEAVRDQYQQNPYPRWVRMHLREQPMAFNTELRYAVPLAQFAPLPDDTAPEVLIAGCGTGRDAIFAARRYRGARVLAIDLSVDSIAYAMRKTQELGLSNVEYAQADVLKLGQLARTFDIIESVGVLHHLADPFAGWRILLSRLRPGGFMRVGLYSQIARRPVMRAREFIAARGYASTTDDIRRFRQDAVAAETSEEVKLLSRSHAFYSLSDCRDLAFHVQEQQLTLAQVETFLREHGLAFIGFELEMSVLNRYRAGFGEDPTCTNLRNWARFEAENPDTFTGMYRFWIQRRA